MFYKCELCGTRPCVVGGLMDKTVALWELSNLLAGKESSSEARFANGGVFLLNSLVQFRYVVSCAKSWNTQFGVSECVLNVTGWH